MKLGFGLWLLLDFLFLISLSNVKCVEDSGAASDESSCQNRNFLIISTVDGVVTALDMNTGKKCWSVVLDAEKFLSSSLSEFEIYENGRRIWLVPSLDGGLYKYDNFRKVIQPLPVDVDSLISRPLYFDPSTSVIGGKVKVLYGISRETGEIIYVCKMEGCTSLVSPFPQNMLIIEEITQFVNAIDSSKAEKKWHFRVSELTIKLTSQVSSDNTSAFENGSLQTALVPRNYQEFVNVEAYKISLQNGFAGMLNKTTQDFAWSFKASCPITDVWYVTDTIVKILDPFDKESGFFSVDMNDGQHYTLLFLGTFENQLFIKKSKNFSVKDANLNALSRNILYETYVIPVCPKSENNVALSSSLSNEDLMNPSWAFNVTDYGSYFYMNYSFTENGTHCIINSSYIVKYEDSVRLSYQVLGIYMVSCLVTCVIFLILFPILIRKILNKEYANFKTALKPELSNDASTEKEFRSRFHQDFEFLSTLGRGGFGVVMDVKNKIDDCRYAVKRIRLHEQLNNAQYEKVLREVKALAKLDHHGIVRYFNAWTEYPPMGWQEEKDKEYNIFDNDEWEVDSGSSVCIVSNTSEKPSEKRKKTASISEYISKPKKQKVSENDLKNKLNHNPLALFEDDLLNNYSQSSEASLLENLDISDSDTDSSESDQSTSSEDSCLATSHVSHFRQNYEESNSDSFSVEFVASDKSMPNEETILSKETDSESSHESICYEKPCKEDMSHHVKCSHVVTCQDMLRSLNEKIIYKLSPESFDMLCTYFFHDASISGISVTERSDWKKTVNDDVVFNKVTFHHWLICILCLIRSSKILMCPILIKNLYYILSDVNKRLNSVKNGFAVPEKHPHRRMHTVQFLKKERKLSNSSKESLLSDKSKASKKSSEDVPRGYLYIQMQLCQKESLRDWLDVNRKERDYNKVMDIFSQIVEAVHYVHNCGLMHRDLKPSNIYFSLEGAIKVGDFGLATSSEIHESSFNTTIQSFTHTSDIGTEIYMSPEQKQKQDYDSKTDIYSLGIILFELLVPFRTVTERFKVLLQVREHQFPEDFKMEYKKESELLSILLNDNPAKRPTTDEIKRRLEFISCKSHERGFHSAPVL